MLTEENYKPSKPRTETFSDITRMGRRFMSHLIISRNSFCGMIIERKQVRRLLDLILFWGGFAFIAWMLLYALPLNS